MKNLKKVLSLVLALAMALSLMTVAFAKEASDYTDYNEITHKEAVEVLTALNVIDGMGNDTFQPNGTLTRAQMAKMITIISLGDVDPSAFLGTTTDLKDINGHWGEAYIKYCYSQGIISGRGNGIFDPNANVTAVEAAKMLLTAIGYNSDVQVYTGPNWKINTIRDAQTSGFFADLSVTADKVLTRDEAAQMIYNAVDAALIEKHSSIDRVDGTITDSYIPNEDKSLLSETFGVKENEGILDDVTYNPDKQEYGYVGLTVTTNGSGTPTTTPVTYNSTVDYSNLYQQHVKVLYKDNKDGTQTVYGIYATKGSVMATGVVGDIELVSGASDKVKIGGTEYRLTGTTSGTELVAFLDGATPLDTLNDIVTYQGTVNTVGASTRAYEIALIDNTNDGKGDVIVVYPFSVEKVSYVGTNSFTTQAAQTGGVATGNVKFEDVIAYNGLAKDDYVKVTAADNVAMDKPTYEKLNLVEAKAQAVKVSDGEIQFNDAWYKTDIVGISKAEAGADSKYVEVNGYLFYLDSNSALAGVDDLAVVTGHATNTAGIDNTYTTRLLKADGTTVTVEVDGAEPVNGGIYKVGENDDGYTVLTAVNVENITTTNSDFDIVFALSGKDANLTNTLASMSFTNASGNNKGYFTKTAANAGTYYVNDDAVVFVYNTDGTGSYSVTTGAKLKETGTAVTSVVFAAAVDNSATGYTNIVVAYVVTGSAITTDAKPYGYVVDDTVKYQDGTNKFYTQIKFWDGTTVQTLNTKTVTGDTGVMATAYGLSKGDLFTYELNDNGTIEKLTPYTAETMTVGATGSGKIETAAVTAYADNMLKVGSKYFTTAAGAVSGTDVAEDLKITDDTVIIYVNTADKEGAEGGSIQLASSDTISPNTANFANVHFIANAGGEVELLVVDVNNDILGIQ